MWSAVAAVKTAVSRKVEHFINYATEGGYNSVPNHNEQPPDIFQAKSCVRKSQETFYIKSRNFSTFEAMSRSDRERLIPTFSKVQPADAIRIAIPNPNHQRDRMKPPDFSRGGSVNTLNGANRHAPHSRSRRNEYGKRSTHSFASHSLELFPSCGQNVPDRGASHQFPDDQEAEKSANKRRKCNPQSSPRSIDLTDRDPESDDEFAFKSADRMITTSIPTGAHFTARPKKKQSNLVSGSQESKLLDDTLKPTKGFGAAIATEENNSRQSSLFKSTKSRLYEDFRQMHAHELFPKQESIPSSSFDELSHSSPDQVAGSHISHYFRPAPGSAKNMHLKAHTTGSKRSRSSSIETDLSQHSRPRYRGVAKHGIKKPRLTDLDRGSEDELAQASQCLELQVSSTKDLQRRRESRYTEAPPSGTPFTQRGRRRPSKNIDQIGHPKPIAQSPVAQRLTAQPVRSIHWVDDKEYRGNMSLRYDPLEKEWIVMRSGEPLQVEEASGTTSPVVFHKSNITNLDCLKNGDSTTVLVGMSSTNTHHSRSISITFENPNGAISFKKTVLAGDQNIIQNTSNPQLVPLPMVDDEAIDEGEEQKLLEGRMQRRRNQPINKSEMTLPRNRGLFEDNPFPTHPSIMPREADHNTAKGDYPLLKGFTEDDHQDHTVSTKQKPVRSSQRTTALKANKQLQHSFNTLHEPMIDTASRSEHFIQPWSHPVVFPPVGKQRATVEFGDLDRLDEGEFLNDSLIQFWIRWLIEHDTIPGNEVYFFTSFLYSALTRKGKKGIDYDSVSRWTARVDIFSYRYIVVPINENLHWYLAIIINPGKLVSRRTIDTVDKSTELPSKAFECMDNFNGEREDEVTGTLLPDKVSLLSICDESTVPASDRDWPSSQENSREITTSPFSGKPPVVQTSKDTHAAGNQMAPQKMKRGRKRIIVPVKKYDPTEPAIIMLDSLGTAHAVASRNLKEYLVLEAKTKLNQEIFVEDIPALNAKGLPLQDNLSDCGLFLLGYLARFVRNRDDFVHGILKKTAFPEDYWADLIPHKMRQHIRLTLMKVYETQREQRQKDKAARKALKMATGQAAGIDEITTPHHEEGSLTQTITNQLVDVHNHRFDGLEKPATHQNKVSLPQASSERARSGFKGQLGQEQDISPLMDAGLTPHIEKSLGQRLHAAEAAATSPEITTPESMFRATMHPTSELSTALGESSRDQIRMNAITKTGVAGARYRESSNINKHNTTVLDDSLNKMKIRQELECSAPLPGSPKGASSTVTEPLGECIRKRSKTIN